MEGERGGLFLKQPKLPSLWKGGAFGVAAVGAPMDRHNDDAKVSTAVL
jgi:hypothetical protein